MITNTKIDQIFNDLDRLRKFCRDFGYKFDEKDLYNNKSFIYKQFQRNVAGKSAKNQWEADLIKFKEQS